MVEKLEYPLMVYVSDIYRWNYFKQSGRYELVFKPENIKLIEVIKEIIEW